MRKCKKMIPVLLAVLLLCCAFSTTAFAAGSGDVAGAVQSTWQTASGQIKTVVNNVVIFGKAASLSGRRPQFCLRAWSLP